MAAKKYTFRKILVVAVWLLLGSATVVLLVAAITKKHSEQVARTEINITGVKNNPFVDKKNVIKILERVNGKNLDQAVIGSLNLAEMEDALQKEQWIKKAELFFDNNNVLQVKITEREPVARVFSITGSSFYVDSSLKKLPLSDEFSARVPVFTNFPTDVMVLTKQDSLLLKEVKTLAEFIGDDPFWMAQVEQVDITPDRTFELVPKLGNQVIRFGNADNYREKFSKLLAFYKQVQTRTGWNIYSLIDVRFKDQVVAVRRDAKEIKADSIRAIQIMKQIIADAQKRSADSTNVQLIQSEDSNNAVNSSPVIDDIPSENAVDSKTSNSQQSGSAIPIHVPEKPTLKAPAPAKEKRAGTATSS